MDSPLGTAQPFFIRPLAPENDAEIDLVAARMQATLVEVLGPERGATMYTMEWLRQRLSWHLRPEDCIGQAFLAEASEGEIVDHTLLRIETVEAELLGLIATTYVVPEWRRSGVAAALLAVGEEWLVAHGASTLGTNTSEDNTALIRLYEKHGYRITLRAPAERMVQLTRTVR